MDDLWVEISEIGGKIDKAKNIQEVERLNLEMRKKCEERSKEIDEKSTKKLAENLLLTIDKLRDFYDKWGESQILLKEEELNVVEKVVKDSLKKLDKTNKDEFPEFFDENHRLEAIKGLIALRLMIDDNRKIISKIFNKNG
ncbi:MAG: hypothetical protein MRERC_4c015 [Mycoplasmataceae bacterium RC_NB112A]|nr:MAG: hypothetical protein MRERC_4c015 [Mycoplasmataceae bacterium RC_NB112A]